MPLPPSKDDGLGKVFEQKRGSKKRYFDMLNGTLSKFMVIFMKIPKWYCQHFKYGWLGFELTSTFVRLKLLSFPKVRYQQCRSFLIEIMNSL